ncbi:MAG: molybdate transport system ATP-binding protein [Mycobacterium sp.]|jgi:molybdate transport system ATP-binding protein|nr:molybdate transport system ATP-binding protein [Mycobacterium sp.]
MTGLQVRAQVRQRGVDVEFDVAPGEVVALIGPNGAGKSTVVHTIAGLLWPDRGRVQSGTRVLTDTDSGVFVPAHARRICLMLQDALLFPHLSVLDNVAFGPRSRRVGRRHARQTAQRWLAQVDAAELAERAPRELSGGQAQRVAVARALAADPDVLLLDEPLAGLDIGAASAIRTVLRPVLTRESKAAVLITHDLIDVLTLADRVLVMESGRIIESGPAAQIVTAPRSSFAARIAGVNLVNGTISPDGSLLAADGTRWYAQNPPPGGARAVAIFTPSTVAVFRDAPHGSPRNSVPVIVAALEVSGSSVRVRATAQSDGSPGLAADVTAEAAAELRLATGDRLHFVVKAHEVAIQPV